MGLTAVGVVGACSSWVEWGFGGTAPNLPSVGTTSPPLKTGIHLPWLEYCKSCDGGAVVKQDFLSSQVSLRRSQANGHKMRDNLLCGCFASISWLVLFSGHTAKQQGFQQVYPVFFIIPHWPFCTRGAPCSSIPPQKLWSRPCHIPIPWWLENYF